MRGKFIFYELPIFQFKIKKYIHGNTKIYMEPNKKGCTF